MKVIVRTCLTNIERDSDGNVGVRPEPTDGRYVGQATQLKNNRMSLITNNEPVVFDSSKGETQDENDCWIVSRGRIASIDGTALHHRAMCCSPALRPNHKWFCRAAIGQSQRDGSCSCQNTFAPRGWPRPPTELFPGTTRWITLDRRRFCFRQNTSPDNRISIDIHHDTSR